MRKKIVSSDEVDEKPLNLERDGKKKINSLEKVIEENISQYREKWGKKIGKENKQQIPARGV